MLCYLFLDYESPCILLYSVCAAFIMVRKKRTTEGPSGGESSETQRPAERSAPPQQQAAAAGGAGPPQGGRAWGPPGGRGGYSGGRGRGMPQQQYGAPPDYQGRGRGASSQQGGRGGYGGYGGYGGGRGGRSGGGPGGGHDIGPSYGGPPKPPSPELHQATSVPYQAGVTPQPASSEAGSSSSLPQEVSEAEQQMGQMTIHSEATPAPPPSSKSSMRFPLRPGKGSYGTKCVVKANHFFAELPNKDLHQYDVSSNSYLLVINVYPFIELITFVVSLGCSGNNYSRSDFKGCEPCCYGAACETVP